MRESLVSAADWRLALAALDQPLGEVFSAHVDASAWDGDDENPTDLTEAYFEYRPYPRAGFRSRVRLGAYYPPFSLENRAHGWETPYAITPSAIDSWIARKIRTVGLEGQAVDFATPGVYNALCVRGVTLETPVDSYPHGRRGDRLVAVRACARPGEGAGTPRLRRILAHQRPG